MEIPPEILKCVVFLCYEEHKDNNTTEYTPFGTAFFVIMSTGQVSHFYLVTAKHCIEELNKKGAQDVYIRMNTTSGIKHIKVTMSAKWYYHPDHDTNPVDVAVTQLPIHVDGSDDIKMISDEWFLKEENITKKDIDIGDDVFITGLFSRHYGQERNLPIVRVGNIAMLSEEKVWTSWLGGKYIDAYLIEARSIGGISGSPVFFREPYFKNGSLKLGQNKYYLAGMIHGHWPVDESKIDTAVDSKKERDVNMGIAIVTPAIKILETLDQKELKDMRERSERNYQNKNASEK